MKDSKPDTNPRHKPTIRVCGICQEQVKTVLIGDESIDFCPMCQQFNPPVLELVVSIPPGSLNK